MELRIQYARTSEDVNVASRSIGVGALERSNHATREGQPARDILLRKIDVFLDQTEAPAAAPASRATRTQ
jgi:hypothetical protein